MYATDTQLLEYLGQYLLDNNNELIDPAALRYVLGAIVQAKASNEALAEYARLDAPRFTGIVQVPTAPAGTNSEQAASTAFVQAALALLHSGKSLSELVLPQDVVGGNWYLTSDGFWEARRSFNAAAAPINGPNWRQVASFTGQLTSIAAANITDATDAGRAMLLAPTAAVQRALVNNPRIAANQYGNHPAFSSEDGPNGVLAWLLKAVLAVASVQVVAAPAAPTAGQVDDAGDTFSFLPNPAYPSFAQYKVNGLPGVIGAVVLDATNSYVAGSRIYIKVVGSVAIGGLAVYVAGSGSLPDGTPLTNAAAFTGAAPAPAPSPAPTPTPTTYTATQQSYTTTAEDYQAACGKTFQGAYAGVTRTNSSQTSTSSQADANAKALAVATQDAKNSITCQVDPVAYDNTLSASQTLKGVTLGAQPGDTLEFNNAAGADNSGITMELWLANEQVASVPYENYYTGKPFRYAHNGTKYTKNFTAGRVDL